MASTLSPSSLPTGHAGFPRALKVLVATALGLAALAVGPMIGSAFAAAQFSISDPPTVLEGNSVGFLVTCTDTTAGAPDDCINSSVVFFTSNNTAVAGADYAGHGGTTLNFGGAGSQGVSVTTFNDGFNNEPDETFFGNLHMPAGGGNGPAVISDPQGVAIIRDQAPPPNNPNVDLAISKSDSPDPVRVGDILTYTVLVQNFSGNLAHNVVVNEFLSSSVELVSVVTTQGTCGGFPTVTCQLGTMGGNSFQFIEVRVRPTAAGVLSNSANVSTSNGDFNGANNTASTQTSVFTQGTPPPQEIEDPSEDLSPPVANLSGAQRCELPTCRVGVRSNENGYAIAEGGVVIGSARVAQTRNRFLFRSVRRSIQAGQERTLPLRLTARARRAIRRALRDGRPVRATVKVIVGDTAENERVRRRHLRIVG